MLFATEDAIAPRHATPSAAPSFADMVPEGPQMPIRPLSARLPRPIIKSPDDALLLRALLRAPKSSQHDGASHQVEEDGTKHETSKPTLKYVLEPEPPLPKPQPRPASFYAPPKHHHRPESYYVPSARRPLSARGDEDPKPWQVSLQRSVRPQTARLPSPSPSSVAPAAAEPAAAPPTVAPPLTPRATTPRELSASWDPVAASWTHWSVSNAAYPALAAPRPSTPRSAARRRYAHASAEARERQRRGLRPTTAPVRLKHPWGEGGGPLFQGGLPAAQATAPGSLEGKAAASAVTASGARDGGTWPAASAGEVAADAAGAANGDGSSGAPNGGAPTGGGLGGLGGAGSLFGKKGKFSLKAAARLAAGLSAAQARARAMERERLAAEREAHLHSLRTALGTPAPQDSKLSTAAAIEASMEAELLRAIPPPREASPVVLRREINRLERRIIAENEPPSPRPRRTQPRRQSIIRSQRTARSAADSGGDEDASSHAAMSTPREAPSRSYPPAERPPPTPSTPRAPTAPSPFAAKAVVVRPAAPPAKPTAPSRPAAAAMLPPNVLADYDSVSIEALPMPLPRRRGKPRDPQAHVLHTAQSHTIELQDVLYRSSHLMRRPTLRKLVARILDAPELDAKCDADHDAEYDGLPLPPEDDY